jgi:hypothetical protein
MPGKDGGGLPPKKIIKLTQNLRGVRSSELRRVIRSAGHHTIGEMVYSFNFDGDRLYNDFETLNVALKAQKLEFPDNAAFAEFLALIEDYYAKSEEYAESLKKESSAKYEKYFDKVDTSYLKASEQATASQRTTDLKEMISSEVRRAILAIECADAHDSEVLNELAQRLYAVSVNGEKIDTLDRRGAVFVSGMKDSVLTEARWQRVVDALSLSQSKPLTDEMLASVAAKQTQIADDLQALEKRIDAVAKGEVVASAAPDEERKPKVLGKGCGTPAHVVAEAKKESKPSAEAAPATLAAKGAESESVDVLAERQEKILTDLQTLQTEVDQMSLSDDWLALKKQQVQSVEALSQLFTAELFGSAEKAEEAKYAALKQAADDSAADLAAHKSGKAVAGAPLTSAAAVDEKELQALQTRFESVIEGLSATMEELSAYSKAMGV